jgi:O-antigen ligase
MTSTDRHPLTRAERITGYLFLLALFCAPFGTALMNIFVALTLVGFICALVVSPALRSALRAPPALLALALLALLIAGTSWSIGPPADLQTAVRKYLKLLVLPMGIGLSWRDPTLPPRALRCALAGTAVLTASTYLVWIGEMPTSSLGWWTIGSPSDPHAFKNHVTIGILLGFAASACFLAATYRRTLGGRLAAVAAGLWFSVPTVMLGQGRTGYVALFIGLVTVFLLRMRFTPLRTAAGLGAIMLLFVGFYTVSPNFESRTDTLVAELETGDPRTPNGLRLSFMQEGAKMVAEHPLTGLGTGSFAEAYAPTARNVWPAGSQMFLARHQPHSEFMLMAVQLGLPGLALYVALLASLGKATLAVRSFEADALALLLAIYVATSTFNSLLWDPTEGYWFLLLSGCLYSACMRRRPADAVQPTPTKLTAIP